MNALANINRLPLSPVSADEARAPLFMLFAAYPEPFTERGAEKADELQNAKVSAYLIGLTGIPKWAIERTVVAFIQGSIDRPSGRKGKLPLAEEIATEARRILAEEVQRQKREAPRQPEPEPYRSSVPPFMVREQQLRVKYAAWTTVRESASYDEYWALRRARQIPQNATWVPGLNGRICTPPEALE